MMQEKHWEVFFLSFLFLQEKQQSERIWRNVLEVKDLRGIMAFVPALKRAIKQLRTTGVCGVE